MGNCLFKCCQNSSKEDETDEALHNSRSPLLLPSDNHLSAPQPPSSPESCHFHTPPSSPLHSPVAGSFKTELQEIPISIHMSSPTIHVLQGGSTVAGHGLALIEATIQVENQATYYWEWHVSSKTSSSISCMFGVSLTRTPHYYQLLGGNGSASSLVMATKRMHSLQVSGGDVVGVVLEGADEMKKKLAIYRNGQLQEEVVLTHNKGPLYPSVWLPSLDKEEGMEISFVAEGFRQPPPSFKFVSLTREPPALVLA